METHNKGNTIVVVLLIIATLLISAHIFGVIWKDFLGNESGHYIIKKINVDNEANIPTWFSSSILLLCAFLLGIIGTYKKHMKEPYAIHWIILSLIFVFLSCDETAQIHEFTVSYVHKIFNIKYLQFIGWVVPYSIFVGIFAIGYIPFLLHLPANIKTLFASAGFLYVGGALGMELLTGAIGRVVFEGKIHFLFGIIEEIFEMGGIILFIYALLFYISLQVDELDISFKAKKLIEG